MGSQAMPGRKGNSPLLMGLLDCGSVQMMSTGSLLARRQHTLPMKPSARADGKEDAVPIGTNSQVTDRCFIAANLNPCRARSGETRL